jgi:DMSO/TMAO reductase YedYZ molybdopterin-dependent catalytic subunit
MSGVTRREFLRRSAAAAWLGAGGCTPESGRATPVAPSAKSEAKEIIPFVRDAEAPLDAVLGEGLDGRFFTDLSTLTAETLITPTDRFFIRTRCSELVDTAAPWKIRIAGLVKEERFVSLEELKPLVRPAGTHVMECSGNAAGGGFGMLGATTWSGVPVSRVLGMVHPLPEGARVRIAGFDSYPRPSEHRSVPGASWIFTPEQLDAAFLATEMNGAPLPKDHGFPVRLLVPGWYGCTCAKWVDRIDFVAEDEPATPQMREYAQRTHQTGVPELARDYRPAAMEQAAMPVRVERIGKGRKFRVVGVTWGGGRVTEGLVIRFRAGEEYQPVRVIAAPEEKTTWALWSYDWEPAGPGLYSIQLQISDPTVPKRRLDRGFYIRHVRVS